MKNIAFLQTRSRREHENWQLGKMFMARRAIHDLNTHVRKQAICAQTRLKRAQKIQTFNNRCRAHRSNTRRISRPLGRRLRTRSDSWRLRRAIACRRRRHLHRSSVVAACRLDAHNFNLELAHEIEEKIYKQFSQTSLCSSAAFVDDANGSTSICMF